MKYLLIIFVIFLASCTRSPERTKRLIEKARVSNPEYFKDSVRIDTVKTTISVQIPSKPLDVGQIDSLLEEYCTPDTVERLVMKERLIERIKNICKLSARLPIESIYRFEEGNVIIRVDDKDELSVKLNSHKINTFTTVYAPCPEYTIWDIFKNDPWPAFIMLLGWLILILKYIIKLALK